MLLMQNHEMPDHRNRQLEEPQGDHRDATATRHSPGLRLSPYRAS
jgi:hypothetical protein